MNYWFHPEAEDEFLAAIDYYNACEPGLGEDFFYEVQTVIGNILTYPAAWAPIEADVRRCLTHRFPYGVVYGVEPDGVEILAVMNLHRKPDAWRHRIA
jgi:toxin ParE1/3/4